MVEIRGNTIKYSSNKKKKEEEEEKKLIQDIHRLENLSNLDMEDMIILEEKKTKLLEFREKKIKGMMIRSRLHWLQQGEKPSRYFCNLENRNLVSKRMTYNENDEGNMLFDQDDLTKETCTFYKNLYEKRETEDIDLKQLIVEPTVLSDAESQSLEGFITYNEAVEVLKKMKCNKSPGNSGFTNEFFIWGTKLTQLQLTRDNSS